MTNLMPRAAGEEPQAGPDNHLGHVADAAPMLIREAGNFFNEFRSPSVLSLPHYRTRVDELKALGMVWPQALWALLDDLDQRGVRRL